MQTFDVVIIGAGPGGLAAADILAKEKRVLVVENNLWGGTCPNFGCDPKKLLYSATQAQAYAKRMQSAGVIGETQLDWPKMMAFKRSYTSGVPSGTLAGLKASGVETVQGTALFVDAHTIEINNEKYHAEKIIIATGQAPTIPEIEGKKYLQTSTDFLDLDSLPKKIAMIGGGFVGLELANIAASSGSEVHVINHSDQLLRQYPKAAVDLLVTAMQDKGIIFHNNISLTKAVKTEAGLELSADNFNLTVDAAFASAGRHPVFPDGLSDVGVAINKHGIEVNDNLETSVPGIFAIGDVSSKMAPKLTPISRFEGRYVARYLLGKPDKIDYPAIPQTLFSTLELAKVGISLEYGLAAPEQYEIHDEDVTKWFTYLRTQENQAHIWTIIDKDTQTLAGAVILASETEELSNLFAAQINQQMTTAEMDNTIYAYPSASSDIPYLV